MSELKWQLARFIKSDNLVKEDQKIWISVGRPKLSGGYSLSGSEEYIIQSNYTTHIINATFSDLLVCSSEFIEFLPIFAESVEQQIFKDWSEGKEMIAHGVVGELECLKQ